MPLTLVPPRKGFSKNYRIRGTVKVGRDSTPVHESTGLADRKLAKQYLKRHEHEEIQKLLARWVKKGQPGRKAGAITVKDLACKIALRILDDEAQRPPQGYGRQATLASIVNAELVRHGHRYKDDSVRKMIVPSVRDWEEKHRK